ncbi:MAG: amidophosphoribosyltransferase [Planctomycetes bacterium]|nr:amidophosphoribosyltransferase [Planctomycetota bacterium]MCW8134547.1 amidophosphoribosyltransferase [Planctomycetota bacterium]
METAVTDHPREACGIFAVFNHPDAVELSYYGLFALQHRGQESAGIACIMDNRIKSFLGMGLVGEVFSDGFFDKFNSRFAIGHTRYSTAGSSNVRNAQPITVDYSGGQISVAHNGNLSNGWQLRRELEEQGSIFQTTSDSEVVLHLLARPEIKNSENPIAAALARMQGAFSFVFLTNDAIYATRDPQGFRPLALGKLGDAHVLASETCAFDMLGIEYVRDIKPGELLRIDHDGLHSRQWCEPQRHAHCIFEHVYFARPDSRVFGINVHLARKEMGKQLARESHVPADIVVPVPDSGTSAAQGYAEQVGLPLEQGFIRNHYVGRTFIAPSQGQRDIGVKIKLNAVRDVVEGKRVIVVDDSIIRGTTSRGRVKRLYEAGAKEVHLRISCPPTRHPCFYGIDFPDPKELIANQLSDVEKIRDYLGIDSLAYLSVQGLRNAVGDGGNYCAACFTGEYPVAFDAAFDKTAMEAGRKC